MDEVRKAKTEVLCHTKACCNIFKIGSNNHESEETRVRNSMMEDVLTVPRQVFNKRIISP